MSEPTTLRNAVNARIDRIGRLSEEMRTEMAIYETALSQWPKDLLITRVHHNTVAPDKLGALAIFAQVSRRADAIEYLSAFTLEPQVYLKRGSISGIYAKTWARERDLERADTEIDCLGAYWRFADNKASLRAFTMLGTVQVSLDVSITADPARRLVRYEAGRDNGRVEGWTLEKCPAGEPVIYSSGSAYACGDVQMYFIAEPGGAAPTLEYYLLEHTRTVNWH